MVRSWHALFLRFAPRQLAALVLSLVPWLLAGAVPPFSLSAPVHYVVSAPVVFARSVWTVGWQKEIDECRGPVDLSARYGVPVIAEHWSCGGAHFPREGSTITLSGELGGTFRVGPVAAELNVATDRVSAIPHGFDLLYQTCRNGSSATMSFTELTRIR